MLNVINSIITCIIIILLLIKKIETNYQDLIFFRIIGFSADALKDLTGAPFEYIDLKNSHDAI